MRGHRRAAGALGRPAGRPLNALGDFQTPPALAARVVAALRARGVEPARILEPTCGSGAFLAAAAAAFPRAERLGIEYQRERYGAALAALRADDPALSVRFANAYETDFGALPWRQAGPLLVVGNPPWVTAAALGRVERRALQPPRTNPKRLRGLAARTGSANFDVAEFLILKLLSDFRGQAVHLAMLVKESVARNVIGCADRLGLNVANAEIVRIDARAWFGVAVDACCLMLATAPDTALRGTVAIRPDFASAPCAAFTPPSETATRATVVWRQGIKHDAAAVFELRAIDGGWRNGFDETVVVEERFVFPLLKARALHTGSAAPPMALIVPQATLGAATAGLEHDAPLLWRYLLRHAGRIAARKSSIYRNAPPFSCFGIGAYSFAPWKVAVAGLYEQARFRVVGPCAGRPTVLGDTAYFVPFADEADARAFAARCTSPEVAAFIAATAVRGKRPITKSLLDSIPWPA